MTLDEKFDYLWNAAYQSALGAGLDDPFRYADRAVATFEKDQYLNMTTSRYSRVYATRRAARRGYQPERA